MIGIVSATRETEEKFWNESALGVSLRRLTHDTRLRPRITFQNQRGLPHVYNESISKTGDEEVLVFVHDDVWIDDYFFADRILTGLRAYDVVGVAGNRRRVPYQSAWAFKDGNYNWDDETHLSGSIAHGPTPFGPITYFGPVPAECELLDGVLLAARTAALGADRLMFDPRFDFHFYDVDFCRNARARGLRLGTWPICLTHRSGGSFGTEKWCAAYHVYMGKWKS